MSNNDEKETQNGEEVDEFQIYVVKVPAGREVQLIFLIKWRAEVLGLPVVAAFSSKSQDGVVFVEAPDYDTVVRAVRNFRHAVVLPEPLALDNVEQYLREFKVKYEREIVKEEKPELYPGMIVEIISGPFKGRKARIVSLTKKKAWVDLMGGGALLVEIDIDHIAPVSG